MFQEETGKLDVALTCGGVQRGDRAFVVRICISPMFKEESGDGVLPLFSR